MSEAQEKVEAAMKSYEELSRALSTNLIVGGKTIQEWKRIFFSVRIPRDMTPMECRKLSTHLLELNQIASMHLAEADAKLSMIESTSDNIYNEKYRALVAGYRESGGKVPAASMIEAIAKADTEEVRDLNVVAEFEKNFWRNIINYITRKRKQLENITMNNALMNKIEGYTITATNNEEEEGDVWGFETS